MLISKKLHLFLNIQLTVNYILHYLGSVATTHIQVTVITVANLPFEIINFWNSGSSISDRGRQEQASRFQCGFAWVFPLNASSLSVWALLRCLPCACKQGPSRRDLIRTEIFLLSINRISQNNFLLICINPPA